MNDQYHRRISIKDVARAAGVTHSTVSRALHDSPLINVATRQRIQDLAARMGYTPNAVAQSLQNRRSQTIGLVVTSIADPFFADVVEGVEEVASRSGLSVFISVSNNDPEREIKTVETFHRRRVDGLIVAASRLGERQPESLERIQVPIVLLNRQSAASPPRNWHSVSVDDQSGAQQLTDYLLKIGHRRIGYLGLGNRYQSNQNRLAGFQSAYEQASHPELMQQILIVPSEYVDVNGDVAAGEAYFPILWQEGVSAVFCYNDRVAIGALLACRKLNINIPNDCSIAGFDDIDLAQYVTPPLTTIRQPTKLMGAAAMQMVLDMQNALPVADQVFQPELIIRGSTTSHIQV